MKKILLVITVLVLTLVMSGCNKESKCVDVEETTEPISIIAEIRYKNSYYTFEEGNYYKYQFEVDDAIFKYKKYQSWFKSYEDWDKGSIVVITVTSEGINFLRLGSLNYEEETNDNN